MAETPVKAAPAEPQDTPAEPPAKKRKVREKSAEEIEAAKAKREAKQKKKEAEKQQAKEARANEKAEMKRAQEQAKELEREIRELKRGVGDALKPAVQARTRSLSQPMPADRFSALFAGYERIKVTHTEESSRRGITTKSYTKYSMTGDEAAQLFGVTKVRGGSYRALYGSTTWSITSLTAEYEGSGMKLSWTLDDNAYF